jgi:hypothetical protein
LWERPTALPANACPIQPVHRFKFDHTNASHQRITPPHHTTTPPHKTFLPSAGAVLQTLTIEGADVIPFIHAICTNARASERLSSVTEVVMKVGGW